MPTPGIDSIDEIKNRESKPLVKLSPDPFKFKDIAGPLMLTICIMFFGWALGYFFLVPKIFG